MYYIRKYADCWAVHNDATGKSRPLTEEERQRVQQEFTELADKQLRTIFTEQINSLKDLP